MVRELHRRRSLVVLTVVAMLAALLVAVPVTAAPPDNPFVGSWESFDNYFNGEFLDTSHVRLHISNSGQWQFRDDAASYCFFNGQGFVPYTVQGPGEFDGSVFYGSGESYCYPDGSRRQLMDPFTEHSFVYDEASDTLFGTGTCFWRTGRGDPSDCPV